MDFHQGVILAGWKESGQSSALVKAYVRNERPSFAKLHLGASVCRLGAASESLPFPRGFSKRPEPFLITGEKTAKGLTRTYSYCSPPCKYLASNLSVAPHFFSQLGRSLTTRRARTHATNTRPLLRLNRPAAFSAPPRRLSPHPTTDTQAHTHTHVGPSVCACAFIPSQNTASHCVTPVHARETSDPAQAAWCKRAACTN